MVLEPPPTRSLVYSSKPWAALLTEIESMFELKPVFSPLAHASSLFGFIQMHLGNKKQMLRRCQLWFEWFVPVQFPKPHLYAPRLRAVLVGSVLGELLGWTRAAMGWCWLGNIPGMSVHPELRGFAGGPPVPLCAAGLSIYPSLKNTGRKKITHPL